LLLPRPVEKWDAALSIYAVLGDVLFQMDFKEAFRALTDVMHCPDAPENPFVRLRLGQVALELGDEAKARAELAEAVRLQGSEILEDEDPKYRSLL
jgi:hypothetical protein